MFTAAGMVVPLLLPQMRNPQVNLGVWLRIEETRQPINPAIRLAVMMTVLLSIFVHGLTAKTGIDFYARKIAALGPSALEHDAEVNTARILD